MTRPVGGAATYQRTGDIDNSKVTKATLFQMDLSQVRVRPGGSAVRISNIGLVLTATGAKVPDSILKVNATPPSDVRSPWHAGAGDQQAHGAGEAP